MIYKPYKDKNTHINIAMDMFMTIRVLKIAKVEINDKYRK